MISMPDTQPNTPQIVSSSSSMSVSELRDVQRLRGIFDWHQRGIQALEHQDYQVGVESFGSAVRLLSSELEQQEAAQEREEPATTFALSCLRLSSRWVKLSECENDNTSSNHALFVDHNTFLVDQTVFALELDLFPSVCQDNPDDTTFDIEHHVITLTTAMLSNLALANYLYGLKATAAGAVQRSMTIYDMAAEAGQRCALPLMSLGHQRVLMSIYTNKAHAAYQVYNLSASQHALEIVSFFLNHRQQLQLQHELSNDNDLEDLFINILYAAGHDERPAAAA